MGITTSTRSLRRSKCLVLHSTGLCKSPTLLPLQFLALNGLLALTPRLLPSGNHGHWHPSGTKGLQDLTDLTCIVEGLNHRSPPWAGVCWVKMSDPEITREINIYRWPLGKSSVPQPFGRGNSMVASRRPRSENWRTPPQCIAIFGGKLLLKQRL